MMNVKLKIYILSVCLILSLIACCIFAYLWIDRSITLSYVSQGADLDAGTKHRLELLLAGEWRGMTEDQVMKKLESESARYPKNEVFIKVDKGEGVIWFDQIRFVFEAGKLKSVGGG